MVICLTKCHSLQNSPRSTILALQRCLEGSHFQIILITFRGILIWLRFMEINSVPFEENERLHRAVIKHKIKEESNVQASQILPRPPDSSVSSQIYGKGG